MELYAPKLEKELKLTLVRTERPSCENCMTNCCDSTHFSDGIIILVFCASWRSQCAESMLPHVVVSREEWVGRKTENKSSLVLYQEPILMTAISENNRRKLKPIKIEL
jgi:hypothetical protein